MEGRTPLADHGLVVTTFSTRNDSIEAVTAPRDQVWAVMTDPDLLAELTPLIERIEEDGGHWRWCLTSIEALGVSISPCFTVAMTFDEPERIRFDHDPPAGESERAGANGYYDLEEVDGGTILDIDLVMHVDLPLPKLARGTVEGIMARTTQLHGDRFFANLLDHLDTERIPVPAGAA